MPQCDCGFDFVKAHLKGQRLVSYALIARKRYLATIRREHAIVVEKDAEKKHRLIAKAASSIGSLTQCPDCGAWLLDEPVKKGWKGYTVLRKSKPAAYQTVKRKEDSGPVRKRSRDLSTTRHRR